MKLQGFVGTGSGKMGSSVFVIRNGVQIVRQYQGVVLNPKSAAQREQRAKIKLATQVAAAVAPALIGFRNLAPGVSARNAFVSQLFKDGALSFDSTNNEAVMNISTIRLSNSNLAFGSVSGISATGSTVNFTVYPIAEFNVTGGMVHAYVLRPVVGGGVEIVGSSVTPTGNSVSGTVTTSGPIQAGDRLIVLMSKPSTPELSVAFMNAVGSVPAGDVSLDVVVRQYASMLDFSRSNGFSISVQQGKIVKKS